MSTITQRRVEAFVTEDSQTVENESSEETEESSLTLMEEILLLGLKDQKVTVINLRVTYLFLMTQYPTC